MVATGMVTTGTSPEQPFDERIPDSLHWHECQGRETGTEPESLPGGCLVSGQVMDTTTVTCYDGASRRG